ncbi:MAG: hypothetical protein EOP09_07805 [Proteobacteria bacterium]|nr:MAG: hypothetical protein EOP09_07805 [Pseudomonadota bacterium]
MKSAFAWWTREFIHGLGAEIKIPTDSLATRTILIFAQPSTGELPKIGERVYFEIPRGIAQIESMRTEMHLFLFDQLPAETSRALQLASRATASYTCITTAVENGQGIRELEASWEIQSAEPTTLLQVRTGVLRPQPKPGIQQICAEIEKSDVAPFEYLFENANKKWKPVYAGDNSDSRISFTARKYASQALPPKNFCGMNGWKLVTGLEPRDIESEESDQRALNLVAPNSGSFILVALGRRLRPKKVASETSQLDLFDA